MSNKQNDILVDRAIENIDTRYATAHLPTDAREILIKAEIQKLMEENEMTEPEEWDAIDCTQPGGLCSTFAEDEDEWGDEE